MKAICKGQHEGKHEGIRGMVQVMDAAVVGRVQVVGNQHNNIQNSISMVGYKWHRTLKLRGKELIFDTVEMGREVQKGC